LPQEKIISDVFGQAFVLFKPKDIVSGDFYWIYSEGMADNELTGEVFVAAADCTGHGVPGAIMSVICCNALNEVVVNRKVSEPGKILDAVREIVISNLKGSGNSGQKDGMDIALCKLNLKTKVLKYAGANNPLWIVPAVTENQTLIVEIKADKMPVGLYDNLKPFSTQIIQLKSDDVFYVFSDGYADQFGGPKGKKYKYKQLEELLIANAKLPINEQKMVLNNSFESWRGNLEQIDDVLIIGIRV
jgi:serine phosphatase RsbU (regulator of sigma subunit)